MIMTDKDFKDMTRLEYAHWLITEGSHYNYSETKEALAELLRKVANIETTTAKLREDWIHIWEAETGAESNNEPKEFLALKAKIIKQNYYIEVRFAAGDIFEMEDNNYWFPDSCFEELPTTRKTEPLKTLE